MKKLFLFICLLTTGSILATNFYVRTNADATSWTNITQDASNVVVTLADGDLLPSTIARDSVLYLAPGTYKTTALTVGSSATAVSTNAKIYGGFSGTESTIDLATRSISDKDGNGIIEPWEFTNEAIITTSTEPHKFTGAGISSGLRLVVVSGTGAEINGVTITDFNYLSYAGPISLGMASGAPSAANNVSGKEGVLRLCTVKKIKSAIGIVMSTNKFSIIDRCLIESNVVTVGNYGGAVYLNACGGKVTGSVIRNNAAIGTGGRGAGLYATSLASTNMDAIVENSVVYNNYSLGNGSAIRCDAQSNKRGIQIVNCTVVNNQTTTTGSTATGSVELINGGVVVNSVIVGDISAELRAHSSNNYILNTVYGEAVEGAQAIYGADYMSGKVVADMKFINPTISVGVSIPDYSTPWDATAIAKYNEIRQANFKIDQTNASSSPLVTNPGIKTMPASYLIGGTGAAITLTATVPSIDLMGISRPVVGSSHLDLGAYQYSSIGTILTSSVASTISIYALNEAISINADKGQRANVYTITGQLIKSISLISDKTIISISNGLYLVKVGSSTTKVLVRSLDF